MCVDRGLTECENYLWEMCVLSEEHLIYSEEFSDPFERGGGRGSNLSDFSNKFSDYFERGGGGGV